MQSVQLGQYHTAEAQLRKADSVRKNEMHDTRQELDKLFRR